MASSPSVGPPSASHCHSLRTSGKSLVPAKVCHSSMASSRVFLPLPGLCSLPPHADTILYIRVRSGFQGASRGWGVFICVPTESSLEDISN